MDSEFANAVELSYECAPLLESLKEYSEKDIACFDVPGHVKNRGVAILNKYLGESLMKMDINSSPTMDNVSAPNGIIKNAQDLLAQAYMADEAFFITNGTTQAIHAMILSVIKPGEKVLLPRNIHKSVINALILCGGIPIFIQPEFDEKLGISLNITLEKVRTEIEKDCNIKALFFLNPTYYGVCADLESIIELCHKNNVLVLVDEAHGAHFPFHLDLPPSAISLGADMVAVSIHKTGGALTQSSALLLNRDNVSFEKVLQSINMLQSTSASYLLMASIDGARVNLVENGEKQLSKALNLSRYAKSKLNKIDGINVKELNLTGFEVYDLLYKNFSIQVELGDSYNILALVSIGTNKSDIDRLVKALSIIAKIYRKESTLNEFNMVQINPIIKLNPREAFYAPKESVEINSCIDRICGESIMAYPPGIPIIAPGELITEEIMEYIIFLKNSNAYLTDVQDKNLDRILVIK